MFVALVTACGGNGDVRASSDSVGGPGVHGEAESGVHYLDLKVDGIRYEARGNPFGPQVTFGGEEINVRVGGPSTSAVQAGMATSLGDHDIVLSLLVNDIKAQSYGLASSRNKVHRSDTPMGCAELYFPANMPYAKLRGSNGAVLIESVEGTGKGSTYRLSSARGRASGVFLDNAGGEHDVEVTFRYAK